MPTWRSDAVPGAGAAVLYVYRIRPLRYLPLAEITFSGSAVNPVDTRDAIDEEVTSLTSRGLFSAARGGGGGRDADGYLSTSTQIRSAASVHTAWQEMANRPRAGRRARHEGAVGRLHMDGVWV